ncbi:MAG: TrmH family RNA methyltransferase [Terracidiphilus sp.]
MPDSQSQHALIEVVLVSPRNPLNIGAAARAMANFGFARLAVVAPYEPHWREAKSDPHWREAQSAIGADDLLQNARITESLADAIADCTLIVGTGSLDYRKPRAAGRSVTGTSPAHTARNRSRRPHRPRLRFGKARPSRRLTSRIAICSQLFPPTPNSPQ